MDAIAAVSDAVLESSRIRLSECRAEDRGCPAPKTDLQQASFSAPGRESDPLFGRALRLARRAVQLQRHSGDRSEISINRVVDEFLDALRLLSTAPRHVTVYGSARPEESSPLYRLGRELGRCLAEEGYAVVTGGGPGLMEAANRGAKEAEGHSIGFNILLPCEQKPNPYLDQTMNFEHFFVRKAMLRYQAQAIIALPGGFGTMDELFEALTLRQTGKMNDIPIVLVGRKYWQPLLQFARQSMLAEGFIDAHDADGLMVVDSPAEAMRCIANYRSVGAQ